MYLGEHAEEVVDDAAVHGRSPAGAAWVAAFAVGAAGSPVAPRKRRRFSAQARSHASSRGLLSVIGVAPLEFTRERIPMRTR